MGSLTGDLDYPVHQVESVVHPGHVHNNWPCVQSEGQACKDPGARTPVGNSGNFVLYFQNYHLLSYTKYIFENTKPIVKLSIANINIFHLDIFLKVVLYYEIIFIAT
jgi:hypothetical protein